MRLLFIVILMLAPSLAAAMGCSDHQAMSCGEGTVWDPETRTCTEKLVG